PPTAPTTDHTVIPSNSPHHEPSRPVTEALDPIVAIEALTINPAAIFGLEDRLGSLAVGRDADIVIWSTDPLDLDSRAETVFVSGRRVFDFHALTGTADYAHPHAPTPIH